MPEEFNQYNSFFGPDEVKEIPGDDNIINKRILQYEAETQEGIDDITGLGEDFSDAIVNSHLPVLEIILLDLQTKLTKIPEVNLSDRNESVTTHMRRADLENFIRKLEEEISLKKTGKNIQAPYAHMFDEGSIDVLDIDIKLLSNQSPISTLHYLEALEKEINTLTDPNSDIFKQLYYQLSTHQTLTASEYNNTYDYSVLYEQHIRTNSDNDLKSRITDTLKMTETTLAQKRINILGWFIKQDNESANHEFVMEHIQDVLYRIQTKRNELREKLEAKIVEQLSTENEGIRAFGMIEDPTDSSDSFYVVHAECQVLQNCAHNMGLIHLKLLDEEGEFLNGKVYITDNYKHIYTTVKKEITKQTEESLRSYLQEGEEIHRNSQK